MKKAVAALVGGMMGMTAHVAGAEILAMMNYETKSPDQLKALKLSGEEARREGIAIMDVDPKSESFGKILVDIPLNPESITHHIFYDRTMTKAYVTSLAEPPLQVIDMEGFPYRLRTIDIPNCSMAEDVIFDQANENWYLTCMDSANVWRGDVSTDRVTGEIKLPGTHPHGLGVDSDIGRIVVTSTVSGDLQTPHEFVSIVDEGTLRPIGQIKLSMQESPSGEAPVEVLPVPGADTPTFYVTNMFGATLWALTWNADAEAFEESQVFDFKSIEAGVALEMYFNEAADRLYVTTAVPGQLHVFDMADGPLAPKLLRSISTGEGAHHVAVTQDEKYGFVQNSLLNLPGMSEGTITVVDLQKGEAVASIDTLKNMGLNPNSIVLLPEWNHFAGH